MTKQYTLVEVLLVEFQSDLHTDFQENGLCHPEACHWHHDPAPPIRVNWSSPKQLSIKHSCSRKSLCTDNHLIFFSFSCTHNAKKPDYGNDGMARKESWEGASLTPSAVIPMAVGILQWATRNIPSGLEPSQGTMHHGMSSQGTVCVIIIFSVKQHDAV